MAGSARSSQERCAVRKRGRKVAEVSRSIERVATTGRVGTPLGGFLILYVTMYSAFGVASPFLPSFIAARGVPPEQIGMLFAAGTAIRLVSAPIPARLADR